ncbi:MAG: L-2,4-diaminobutyric acid acetyltransferase [Akkermansiaceae bacterium]|jgi:L-2,4-diaminobutyric acid acetyltransferase
MTLPPLHFARPTTGDALKVKLLVAASPPLDANPLYCNLLQCSHFASTCVCAKEGDELVGFVSGYLLPDYPTTLFIWQVAVSVRCRGRGLAMQMIKELRERPCCQNITHLETTITPSNKSSGALFTKLGKQLRAPVNTSVAFDRDEHFGGSHETEILWSIGPLPKNNKSQ